MNFAAIREAIRVAVRDATGAPDSDVSWAGTVGQSAWQNIPAASGRPPMSVELKITSVEASGIDEVRYHYDSGTDTRTEELCGNREITVSVKIESDSQDDGEESPGQLASYLRARLRRPSALRALQAAGLGLAEIHATTNVDYVDQDRMLSVSVTDLLFNAAESDVSAPSSTGWIDSVKVTLLPDLLPRSRVIP